MFSQGKSKIISILLLIFIIATMLSSCKKLVKDGLDYGDDGANSPLANLDKNATLSDERKLIREVDLRIQTKDLTKLLQNLLSKSKELGGYVDNESVSDKRATIVFKIPSEKLDTFVEYTKSTGNITRSNLKTIDVTLEHIDMEARIKSLEAQLLSLQKLLDTKASYLNEIIDIMKRIKEVEAELESCRTALAKLNNRITYSTVSIVAEQHDVITHVSAKGMWGEIANKFLNNLNRILSALKTFFIWFVSSIPYFALIAIIAFIIRLIFKAIKKHEKKKSAKKAEYYKQLMNKPDSTNT